MTETRICPRCGRSVRAASGAPCPGCAAPLGATPVGPPPGHRCPACGSTAPLRPDGACTSCGLHLAGAADAVEPSPVQLRPRARRFVAVVVAAALVLVVVLVAALAGAGDGGLDPRWRLSVGEELVGAAVAEGTTAFVATAEGTLVAVDLADGRARWRFETGERVVAPPVLMAGTVLVATAGLSGSGGHLYAVDTRTGEEQWRFTAESGVGPPAAHAGSAYVVAGDVVSLDVRTGEEQWRRTVEAAEGPLTAGDGLVVALTATGLQGLEARTGAPRWGWSASPRAEVPPVVAGGRVLTGDGSGSLVALDAVEGRELWRSPTGGLLSQTPAADGSVVVAATVDGVLALHPADGERLWRAGPSQQRLRVTTDGAVVVVTGGDLAVLDARTGRALGRGPLPPARAPAHPSLVDGEVLVAGGEVVELWATP